MDFFDITENPGPRALEKLENQDLGPWWDTSRTLKKLENWDPGPSGNLVGPYKKTWKPGTETLEKPKNRDPKKQNTLP